MKRDTATISSERISSLKRFVSSKNLQDTQLAIVTTTTLDQCSAVRVLLARLRIAPAWLSMFRLIAPPVEQVSKL
jgi:hypothetical protein